MINKLTKKIRRIINLEMLSFSEVWIMIFTLSIVLFASFSEKINPRVKYEPGIRVSGPLVMNYISSPGKYSKDRLVLYFESKKEKIYLSCTGLYNDFCLRKNNAISEDYDLIIIPYRRDGQMITDGFLLSINNKNTKKYIFKNKRYSDYLTANKIQEISIFLIKFFCIFFISLGIRKIFFIRKYGDKI